MSEDVYAMPDLTKKVRYGPRERAGETEDRGDWEDKIVDIYVTADYPDRNPAPKPGPKPDPDPDPGPGTQLQDAARNNTAQQQRGAPKESKQNLYLAVVVACVVLLCLLLLAGIIVLLILYGPLIKEKNILQSSLDELLTRHYNLTDQRDQWKTLFDNMTEQRDKLETRLNNMTDKLDDLKSKMKLCDGFTLGGDGCYYISTEAKTWEDSRAFCTARQSDLMTIKSQGKKDFVKLIGKWQWVWIGLTDSETEGVWKWVDGTPLTTTPYWDRNNGQPDGGREDCVMVNNGEWYDQTCRSTQHWICEIVF